MYKRLQRALKPISTYNQWGMYSSMWRRCRRRLVKLKMNPVNPRNLKKSTSLCDALAKADIDPAKFKNCKRNIVLAIVWNCIVLKHFFLKNYQNYWIWQMFFFCTRKLLVNLHMFCRLVSWLSKISHGTLEMRKMKFRPKVRLQLEPIWVLASRSCG